MTGLAFRAFLAPSFDVTETFAVVFFPDAVGDEWVDLGGAIDFGFWDGFVDLSGNVFFVAVFFETNFCLLIDSCLDSAAFFLGFANEVFLADMAGVDDFLAERAGVLALDDLRAFFAAFFSTEINSALRMSCHPRMPVFFAISESCLTVKLSKSSGNITRVISMILFHRDNALPIQAKNHNSHTSIIDRQV